jgi:hypothetical protein
MWSSSSAYNNLLKCTSHVLCIVSVCILLYDKNVRNELFEKEKGNKKGRERKEGRKEGGREGARGRKKGREGEGEEERKGGREGGKEDGERLSNLVLQVRLMFVI